jgi:hypothetical protein
MNYKLTIGWLYPELMSTYGDRGNIFVLEKRCSWREIGVTVMPIDFSTTEKELLTCDLIFGGGAQDRQQGILIQDLREKKRSVLKRMFEDGTPGLFVCGAPQLLGHSYTTADGQTLEGLGIFDMVSKHPGKGTPRCIGNLVADVTGIPLRSSEKKTMVGFENHGGRTYLGKGVTAFANVIKGFGNNGEDGTEGAVMNACIATYSHGPFLPKNPHIADWLLAQTLKKKYKKHIPLSPLDDMLEWQAHDFMVKKLV